MSQFQIYLSRLSLINWRVSSTCPSNCSLYWLFSLLTLKGPELTDRVGNGVTLCFTFLCICICVCIFTPICFLFGGSDVDICRPPLAQSSLINYPSMDPRPQSAQILHLPVITKNLMIFNSIHNEPKRIHKIRHPCPDHTRRRKYWITSKNM